MHRAALAFSMLALLAVSPAQAGGRVLAYGIYAGQQTTCSLPTGPILNCQMANVALARTATDIPGALGVTFGLDYSVDGAPKPVRTNIIFPPAGLHNPRYPVVHSYATDETCAGADCFISYALDFPWEVVPGIWTFQIWADGQLVVQKRFNVYLPDTKKKKPGKGRLVASAGP